MSASADGPDSFVMVDRDPAETDTGNAATPAAMIGTQSWAEDVPTESNLPASSTNGPAANGGDGFHEVHHGRGRGRGEYRGKQTRERVGVLPLAEEGNTDSVLCLGQGGRGRGGRGGRGDRGDRGDRGGRG